MAPTTGTRARESTAPVKANELPQQPRSRLPVGLAGLNLSTQVISSTAPVRQNCPPSHQPPQPVFETTCHKVPQPRRTTCQISTFPLLILVIWHMAPITPEKHLIKPASSSLFQEPAPFVFHSTSADTGKLLSRSQPLHFRNRYVFI
jgi:hypothetical protein